MTDTEDWLDQALRDQPAPAPADAAFLARLKTIPAQHAQPAVTGWRALQPWFRPVRLSLQGGVLAACLLAGVLVGARQDAAPEEIDLTDYLAAGGWEDSL
ncbi:MAG: hypothetical protein ACFB22_06295 [Rhodothalassiaceae bacterium]